MVAARTRSNFILYVAFHVARYAFPLVVTPFFARILMKEGFGHYAVINSCVWTSSIFMEFGFYLYGITRIAAAEGQQQLSSEASSIIGGKVFLAPVCIVAYFTLAGIAGVLVSNPLAVMLGTVSALAYGGSFAWYFQGRQRGATAVALEGGPQIAQLVLFLLFIRSPRDLWLVFLIQALAPVTSVIASVLLMRREGLRLRPDVLGSKAALRGARPYFVQRLCFAFYTAVSPTMVAVLSNVQEAALFAIGDKVGIFLGSLALPVSQTMMPVIAQKTRSGRSAWRTSLLVVGGTILFCGGVALVVFFTVGIAVDLVFSQSYAAAIPVARIFCVAAVFTCVSMAMANFVIIPRGAAKILMVSAGAGLVISLLLQVVLVPNHGAIGGAIGAAFARAAADMATAAILSVRAVMLYRESRRSAAPAALQDVT